MTGRDSSKEAEERREIERHDELYRQQRPRDFRMVESDWRKFEGVTVPLTPYFGAVLRLGDVRGKRVLDLGCGDGWFSVILAKRGAHVTAFDVSIEAIRTAQQRAAANDVTDRTDFAVASAYHLPFATDSFDLIAGMAILHHVTEKETVARELRRILKPGGRGVFMEPLGDSLLLERIRQFVPVPSGAPDDPDQWRSQFKHSEIAPLRAAGLEVGWQDFHLFSRLDRVTKSESIRRALNHLDRILLATLPPLRRFARAIVVEIRKPAAA